MDLVDITLIEKELPFLPKHIFTKLYRWIKIVEDDGLSEVRKIPSFHDEPLKGAWHGARSVRLNRSYRAIYKESNKGEITIIQILKVSKHEY